MPLRRNPPALEQRDERGHRISVERIGARYAASVVFNCDIITIFLYRMRTKTRANAVAPPTKVEPADSLAVTKLSYFLPWSAE
jgi:hypothetical protein